MTDMNPPLQRRLRDYGITIVQEPSQCTHLAATSMIRTQKFVMALAYGPVVISTSFIDDCVDQGKLLSPDDYVLEDKASEERLGINLRESLARARLNKRQLLRGVTIYVTPTVHGGVDTYKAIVEANGGVCLPFRARGVVIAPPPPAGGLPRNGGHDDDDDDDEEEEADDDQAQKKSKQDGRETRAVYLLSGETAEERKVWAKFRQTVLEAGYTARIVQTEWLLDVAMSQEMRWRDDYELRA